MAQLINLQTFTDKKGNLTVIEKIIPFDVKRIFYIYGMDDSVRGGHRHHRTVQAAICLKGSCKIYSTEGNTESRFKLDSPAKCLIIYPQDWHIMYNFTADAILMVLASEYFDPKDYIFEKYAKI
jgi:hypothetical protein